MSETDSFIDEVSEEVRRDRLFKFFKKYAWVFIGVVLLIVGGAATNEYLTAKKRNLAQANGEALIAAKDAGSAAAFAEIAGDNAAALLAKFEQAAILAGEGQTGAAASILDEIALDQNYPKIYRDLALLKLVMLNGQNMEANTLEQIFDSLTAQDSFFRMLAFEQRAIASIRSGDIDAALGYLAVILADQNVTEALRNRAQELTIALGGETSLPSSVVSDG